MATLFRMIVIVEGQEPFEVWQKTVPAQVQIVTQQLTTYVDAKGNEVALPEVYEMRVAD